MSLESVNSDEQAPTSVEKRGPGRPRTTDSARDTREQVGFDSRLRPQGRGRRVPLGGFTQRLGGEHRPGYVARWFNDEGGRIAQALEAGYEFVYHKGAESTDPGNRISQIVSKETGMRAYMMEIREEWYNEDQAVKQKSINEVEAQFKRGKDIAGEPGIDGRYIPSPGINIK